MNAMEEDGGESVEERRRTEEQEKYRKVKSKLQWMEATEDALLYL